ncbi:MAG: hypothetical protein WCJ99_06325 [Betaproteobacteria bacterium]
MNKNSLLMVACLMPLFAWAAGDECINESNGQLKLLCQAKHHASAGYCDKITSMGPRMECISAVRNRQREINWAAPKPKVLPPPIQY